MAPKTIFFYLFWVTLTGWFIVSVIQVASKKKRVDTDDNNIPNRSLDE